MNRSHLSILLCLLITACGLSSTVSTRAQETRQSILDSIRLAPNDTTRANWYHTAGHFYWQKAGYDKVLLDSALYFLEIGRKMAIQTRQNDNYIWSLYLIANVRYRQDLPWLAAQLAPALTEDQEASIYANLSYHYSAGRRINYSYNLDTAILYGQKAMAIAERLGHPQLQEYTARALAIAYVEYKKYPKVYELFPKLNVESTTDVLHRLSNAYLASTAYRPADLDSAEATAWRAIASGKAMKNPVFAPTCYFNLARVAAIRENPVKASAYVTFLTPENKGTICNLIAQLYMKPGGNADSALYYAELSKKAYQQARMRREAQKADDLVNAATILVAGYPRPAGDMKEVERCRSMIAFARKYQSGYPDFDVTRLTIAANYLDGAVRLAETLRIDSLKVMAWTEMCKTQLMLSNIPAAKSYFEKVLRSYPDNCRKGDAWRFFADNMRTQRVLIPLKAEAYGNARQLYAACGNSAKELDAGLSEASNLQEDGRADPALALLRDLYAKYPAPPVPFSYRLPALLAQLAQRRGHLSAALEYATAGLRQAESHKDVVQTQLFHIRLAETYDDLGQTEKSIEYYRRIHENALRLGIRYDHYSALRHVELLIQQGQPAQALQLVEAASRVIQPGEFTPEKLMKAATGLCYEAMGNPAEAERHFLASIEMFDQIRVTDRLFIRLHYYVGRFYLSQRKYTQAAAHFRLATRYQPDVASVALTNNAHYMLYHCDSAMGNIPQALASFRLHKYYSDSMFNIGQARQISELHIRYETEKKDQSLQLQAQELKINKQNIDLLTSQQQLQGEKLQRTELERLHNFNDARQKEQDLQIKNKDISFLRQQAQLQQSQLDKEILVRNVSFGGGGLLLLVIGLLVSGYRQKQQHNRSLQEKQVEIGQKNHSLEKLVKEKEWLLREIHHRVKNNLQIIMSLLNGQSAYLQNDAALVAIRDSQHRVQAISLIHKKLYRADNVGQINMPHYIHELVEYLIECFDVRHRIRWHIDVAPIPIGVSQAVPIGLILNEAITNSIKYAFPPGGEGMIAIHLEQGDDGFFALTIADNGKGLPPDFQIKTCNSLGMSLMEGLSDDLGGQFSIRNRDGVEICIRFGNDTFAHPILSLQQENNAI